MNTLEGKVIMVTGGAQRVGKAIALALAGEKADVVITYHQSKDQAALTLQALEGFGVRAAAVPCDQSDPTEIGNVIKQVVQQFGRLDGLVNNASIMEQIPFLEVSPEDWDVSTNVNLRGPFFFSQAAARAMQMDGGGVIINLLDESAIIPTRYFVHHSAAKAGLHMLTRSTALALAPLIRVNAVLPGPVLMPDGYDEEKWQRLKAHTPLKRFGTPEDVARAVIYLMKEEHITGQVLAVDGGRTLDK